jgi:hypothetical protein
MNHEFWYLSRAAGFTAYLLLFVSVALGIVMSTRLVERFAKRNTIFDMHRFTTILALAFTLFHVYILLGDGFFNFDVWQLSIPFRTPYRVWQTAVGIGGLYVMLLITVSFYVRKFIGFRAWRALHYLSFGLFAAATLHGITAGSDTTQTWAQEIYLGPGLVTLALIAYRLQYKVPDNEPARNWRMVAGGATAVVALVLVAAASIGSSATPSGGVASEVAAGLPTPLPAAPQSTGPYPFLASFSVDLSGTYSQTSSDSATDLVVDAMTAGDLALRLHLELATTGGGNGKQGTVSVNTAQLRDPNSNAVLCDGQLSAFNSNLVRATCVGTGPYRGVQITFDPKMQTDSATTLSGTMTGTMQRTE